MSQQRQTTGGDLPLEVLETQPTPFYFYDSALLIRTLDTVRDQLRDRPSWQVHYAVKANANPSVLKIIARAGFGADCVSGGEMRACIDAGFPAGSMMYAGVGKTDAEILLGLDLGIQRFNVESVEELEVISKLACQSGKLARISLRVNPDVGAHTLANITTGLAENKFGIHHREIANACRLAMSLPGVDFCGLHFHIGSQILDMSDFVALCNRINDLCDRLSREGISVGDINVGGGLGIDYENPSERPVADFAAYFDTFKRHLRGDRPLHFELGRSIVGPCGSLICKVIYVKQGMHRKFAVVDGSMSELVRPAMYHAVHKVVNLTSDGPEGLYDVVGPVCESSDVFVRGSSLKECRRGDLMAIRSAGAYGETMASRYNGRPLPESMIL